MFINNQKIKLFILTTCALFLIIKTSAQEVRVIDNKGTIQKVNNNRVFSQDDDPNVPTIISVENDVWHDTNDAIFYIWDIVGATGSWKAITSPEHTGITGSVFFADVNGTPTENNNQFFWDNTNNKLGIGTNTPTERLDINGKLKIRTLNNASPTDAILTASAEGIVNKSKINFGGRWTNIDTTTDLNSIGITLAPIFGTEDYKDDGNNLYLINNNFETLTVLEAGRYDIRANISLEGTDRQRTSVNAQIYVNGIAVGAITSTGYIRFIGNSGNKLHTRSSLHLNEILQLNANSLITIRTFRNGNVGVVTFSGANESSIMINKLH